jgi:sensor domain CHASE-containing protein
MKAEHRHELHRNELSEWLSKSPEFFKQNYKMIVYIVVVLVLVGVVWWLQGPRKKEAKLRQQAEITGMVQKVMATRAQVVQQLSQGTDSSANFTQVANQLGELAGETDNDTLAAMALVKQGDAFRAELHYKPVTVEKTVIEYQLNKARQAYQLAESKAGKSPQVKAMARFGQALCFEEERNFSKAKDLYVQLAEDDSYKGTVAANLAGIKAQIIADSKGTVKFAPAPAPVEDPNAPQIPEPVMPAEPVLDMNGG